MEENKQATTEGDVHNQVQEPVEENTPSPVQEPAAPKVADATLNEEEHQTSLGATIGVIIVVLLIALGALYFWGTTTAPEATAPTDGPGPVPTAPVVDPTAQAMMDTDDSDAMSAIETDLENTDLDSIDTEMADIEAELEAEMETSVQ